MRSLISTQDSLITGPTIEPLDLEEVKKALKFAPTSEDTLIDLYISMARQYFEEQTGRQLITATWERWFDGFPDGSLIELPHPPLQTVVSVIADGMELDTADYIVSAPQGPTGGRGSVSLLNGGSWPTATAQAQAVKIRYTAGYGDTPSDVPELVKGVLYFLVGHFHRFRAAGTEKEVTTIPLGAEAILRAFRLSAIPVVGSPAMSLTTITGVTIP